MTTFLVMLPIDIIWLLSMKKKYDTWMSGFERVLNIPAVILVYIFIPLGLSVLVVSKHFDKNPQFLIAAFEAFIFGISAYAVYDLTNLATLKGWPVTMTIVDIFWGGILCTLTTTISLLILQKFA